jgi:dienelactone hydrolase
MKNKIWILCFVFNCLAGGSLAQDPVDARSPFNFAALPDVLPGTTPLTWDGDVSAKILDGAHLFIEEKINESVGSRLKYWNRDFTSAEAYTTSIEPNRKRFMKNLGVEDKSQPLDNYNVGLPDKHPPAAMEKFSFSNEPDIVAETSRFKVYQVRWPVLNRVFGEGLLLVPNTKPLANIIAIPDADQTPEQLAGLSPGIDKQSQFARLLAENGFQVLVPVLINRTFLFQGTENQQTYREWIYRQAFHMGKHLIGFEIQKIISAIDWFKESGNKELKTGVAGYNEGGLIAFYTSAIDKRIDAVLVSGYFNSRQKVWDEPIYRNVWGLLSEFGDAEIATLITPRPLIIEYSSIGASVEKVEGWDEKNMQVEGLPFTGYKGRLETPSFKDVQSEFDRIDVLTKSHFKSAVLITAANNNAVGFGSPAGLQKFIDALGQKTPLIDHKEILSDSRSAFDPQERQLRQVKEMEDHVQWLVRDSDATRNKFFLHKVMPEFAERNWSTRPYHPYFSSARFVEQSKQYRKIFRDEILGSFVDPLSPPNPQTRKLYDKERWTGYEVVLDVYKNVFAAGFLLIPKDIKPNEKRPVVVCQHGRNNIPQRLIEGNLTGYNNVAARLADQGFIVYVPYNPYRGEDRYRWLHRKANALGKTLFSFIISQHDQSLQWLGTLPFVDKSRIAFYGLSYGGETAMRVPAVLDGYSLSICSGDFGDWTRKVADTHFPGSFMKSLEWEMPYFNMGSTFSYAEMAYLIFPRPFMVERGHHDLVQPDEWVAYEYGKVRYFYDQFNHGDKTEIEFFNGGHSMRLEGTVRFLHKHLSWP